MKWKISNGLVDLIIENQLSVEADVSDELLDSLALKQKTKLVI